MADTYSVVDLSKTKKNHSLQEKSTSLEPGTHSVLGQQNFDSEGQDSVQAGTTDASSNAVYEMVSNSTRDAERIYTIAASAANSDKKKIEPDSKQTGKFAFCIAVTVVVLLLFALAIIACLALLFAEVNKLKSETSHSLQQEQTTSNEQPNEAFDYDQLSYLNKSLSAFKELIDQQLNFNVREIQTSTAQMLSSLLQSSHSNFTTLGREIVGLERIVGQLQNRIFQELPASSCGALPSLSPSGYYWVRTSNGSAVRVYCDMTRSCGGVTGGWMRVAELDMTNSSHQCPSELTQPSYTTIRACARTDNSAGCSSVQYSTASIPYSKVCGKVIAYHKGTLDAFNADSSIDSEYVDGVTLTHGRPRQHIWSFAAAHDETRLRCPCTNNNEPNHPTFVGMNYFCDTGADNSAMQSTFYSDDPLWDGDGCENSNICCSFNTPPWFFRELSHLTTDDVEMRVCRDESRMNEDVAIKVVELYVQ